MPATYTDARDGLTTSVAVKAPCKAMAGANIALVGEQTIDGVSCVAGDRVLVMAQTIGTENGIYTVSATAWPRALDFDGALDVVSGTHVSINSGDAFGGVEARVTTADPILIGTSALSFAVLTVAPRSNILHNGDGRIDQRGSGVAQTTADDAYGSSDRWYSLTQTGTITVQSLTDGADGIPYYQQLKQTQATAQRMGRAQVIASSDSRGLRGGYGALSGRIRCSSSQAIRYALLSWTGTANAVTSDVVNSWTNASFTAGGFFNSTTLEVVAVGSITPAAATWTSLTALAAPILTTCNNLIVMIWTEGTAAQNVTLDFTMKLELGRTATPDIPRSTGAEEELCQRRFRRLGGAGFSYFGAGLADTTSTFDGLLLFGPMAAIPSLSASATGDFQVLRSGPAASVCTSLSFTNAYLGGCRVAASVSGTPHTAGDALILRLGASAGYIDVSAEL